MDASISSERTTLMSILAGLGIAVFPLADFLSGQIFNVTKLISFDYRLANASLFLHHRREAFTQCTAFRWLSQ